MHGEFQPFEVSPETALVSDMAHRAVEADRVIEIQEHPELGEFIPAEPADRCTAWSNERRLVGCTMQLHHPDDHRNHTIADWSFTDAEATHVHNREEWIAYLEVHLGGPATEGE